MSSSFVKDCSDVSAPGNTSSGKTVIIIVNNETGNVSLDGSELQNLLGKYGLTVFPFTLIMGLMEWEKEKEEEKERVMYYAWLSCAISLSFFFSLGVWEGPEKEKERK